MITRVFPIAAAVLSISVAIADAAQTASARMHCLSVQVRRGYGGNFGNETLDLTTWTAGINKELAPFGWGYSHWSWVELRDIWGFVSEGTLYLDTPPVQDVDGNGVDDFFEVSKTVSAVVSGVCEFEWETLGVIATWNRAAGSTIGTCSLALDGNGSFLHNFDLLEYSGVLTYTPGPLTVPGSVSLTNVASTAETLRGPANFTKTLVNRLNELTLVAGAWTNAALQSLVFTNDLYLRSQSWPSNYAGFVDFEDGDLNTSTTDYYLWALSINDLNDNDGDLIPDFSDFPAQIPTLSIAVDSTNLLLVISGEIGYPHFIEQTDSLQPINWSNFLSVTLTNNPHSISMPMPTAEARYWRVSTR